MIPTMHHKGCGGVLYTRFISYYGPEFGWVPDYYCLQCGDFITGDAQIEESLEDIQSQFSQPLTPSFPRKSKDPEGKDDTYRDNGLCSIPTALSILEEVLPEEVALPGEGDHKGQQPQKGELPAGELPQRTNTTILPHTEGTPLSESNAPKESVKGALAGVPLVALSFLAALTAPLSGCVPSAGHLHDLYVVMPTLVGTLLVGFITGFVTAILMHL